MITSALCHLPAQSRMDIYDIYIWINYMINPAGMYLLLFVLFLLSYQYQCLWTSK